MKKKPNKQSKKKMNEKENAGEEKGKEEKKGIDDLDMCAAISPFRGSQSKVEKMIKEARERRINSESSSAAAADAVAS